MALSLRGLWISGADVLGMTNCLNFASPEDPEKFYELQQGIKGLADTCRELDCPVVSGNVSLYNETASGRIYPTPLVVTAGLMTDRDEMLCAGNTKEGDLLYLVGETEGSLGASRYQVMKNGVPLGTTVIPNEDAERSFRERAIATARAKTAGSVRAVAGGGLSVALANEAISSSIGMNIDLIAETTAEAMLFSEGGARAIYSVPTEKRAEFENIWQGFPCRSIGSACGEKFTWNGLFAISLSVLKKTFSEEK